MHRQFWFKSKSSHVQFQDYFFKFSAQFSVVNNLSNNKENNDNHIQAYLYSLRWFWGYILVFISHIEKLLFPFPWGCTSIRIPITIYLPPPHFTCARYSSLSHYIPNSPPGMYLTFFHLPESYNLLLDIFSLTCHLVLP